MRPVKCPGSELQLRIGVDLLSFFFSLFLLKSQEIFPVIKDNFQLASGTEPSHPNAGWSKTEKGVGQRGNKS